MKAIIIGAGIIGMMQARELAQRDFQVTIIDKAMCGTESSWAGGGIVSPLYPWRYSEPVTALSAWSQRYYPNLIESIEAESGIDPELTRHGLLMLSVEDRDKAVSWSEREKTWLNQIGQDELKRLESNLGPDYKEALWMPHVASVRTPRLAQALRQLLGAYPNVEIIEESPVEKIKIKSGRAKKVITGKGDKIEGDIVIVCSGAWSSQLLPESSVEIEPVKGQMILFQADPGVVNRVVLNDGRYVIPRRDGRVLAGSTLEYVGYDKNIDDAAKTTLEEAALAMFPKLSKYPITNHWSGLRPGSPKGVPYIGKLPEVDNLYVNAGHFRNGLVLAPCSVRLLADLIACETPPVDPAPYAPSR